MSNDVIISVYHIHHLEFHDRTLHFSVDCKQKVKIWDKLVLMIIWVTLYSVNYKDVIWVKYCTAPERPDTEKFSSFMHSILWTLDNKCGTHIIIIYSPHIIFISNLHISYLYIYMRVCIVFLLLYCTLSIWIFVYYYFYYLCPVAVFLLHCGASVTITNSSYL